MAEASGQVRTQGARPPRLASISSEYAPGVAPRVQAEQDVTVLPAVINLSIYQGDDFFLDMLVTDANNNPVNLSQALPMSQIRPAPDDDMILANLDVEVDATTTNLLHLHLFAADSAQLPATAAWDIQLSVPSITTIAYGTVTVTLQVTQ
jgi:hypothetical protein